MSDGKTFTNVDEEVLIKAITGAAHRLVFIAPGVTERVAEALESRVEVIPKDSAVIVLDVDPEVCRLGYGDIEGLERVQALATKWGITLDHQPGIRIGLLIADGQTLIYAPAPLLIEAGPDTPKRPNAIRLEAKEAPALEAACGATKDIEKREVGLDPVREPQVQRVKQDLAINPPKKFDVSRAERVFNSAMQYVDFHFTKFRLSKKEIPIPSDLMGLADDADLRNRWKNSFRLFGDSGGFEVTLTLKDSKGRERKEVYTERKLEAEKKRIIKEFVVTVPNHGAFILRSRRTKFDARIKAFRELVETYEKAVNDQILEELEKSKKRLIEYLAPIVRESPPALWQSTMSSDELSEEEAEARLDVALTPHFSSVDQVFKPEVEVMFKDISYETIKDKKFLEATRAEFEKRGALTTFERLFKEHDAAPEVQAR
jgi:hypothetical protein